MTDEIEKMAREYAAGVRILGDPPNTFERALAERAFRAGYLAASQWRPIREYRGKPREHVLVLLCGAVRWLGHLADDGKTYLDMAIGAPLKPTHFMIADDVLPLPSPPPQEET